MQSTATTGSAKIVVRNGFLELTEDSPAPRRLRAFTDSAMDTVDFKHHEMVMAPLGQAPALAQCQLISEASTETAGSSDAPTPPQTGRSNTSSEPGKSDPAQVPSSCSSDAQARAGEPADDQGFGGVFFVPAFYDMSSFAPVFQEQEQMQTSMQMCMHEQMGAAQGHAQGFEHLPSLPLQQMKPVQYFHSGPPTPKEEHEQDPDAGQMYSQEQWQVQPQYYHAGPSPAFQVQMPMQMHPQEPVQGCGQWEVVPQYFCPSAPVPQRHAPRRDPTQGPGRRTKQCEAQGAEALAQYCSGAVSSSSRASRANAVVSAPASACTTTMLRNLPVEYNRDMLMGLLDAEGFAGLYDFVYLPMDFRGDICFGYGFINFVEPDVAARFWDHFQGFSRWACPSSDKVAEVSWSDPLQGLEDHIERYRNSPLMHEQVPDIYKPVLLCNGVRRPFPPPTKKLRPPRVRHARSVVDAGAAA